MIVVTGTKRSGTSMWMQILGAAGVPVLGEDFSKVWKETIFDANPRGFYESVFRHGIYYATNPVPATGEYLHPDEARGIAVKVFVPGLCRTDLAYVERVIGTVRHWSEYGTSLDRLLDMEREAFDTKLNRPRPERPRLSPLLEWWFENFLLVRDIATRRYPARLVSYDRVVAEPERWVPALVRWLGVGDADAAVAAVAPEVRTVEVAQRGMDQATDPDAEGAPIDPEHRAAFDALFSIAHDGVPLTPELIQDLNRVHNVLSARITQRLREIHEARVRAAAASRMAAPGGADAEPKRRVRRRRTDAPTGAEVDTISRLLASGRDADDSGVHGVEGHVVDESEAT